VGEIPSIIVIQSQNQDPILSDSLTYSRIGLVLTTGILLGIGKILLSLANLLREIEKWAKK